MPRKSPYTPGDWVVYHKTKHSSRPGPRATDVAPSRGGETYSYVVDKFWIVVDVTGDEVRLRTKRGKEHVLPADDPNLRHATWWERMRHRARFLAVADAPASSEVAQPTPERTVEHAR